MQEIESAEVVAVDAEGRSEVCEKEEEDEAQPSKSDSLGECETLDEESVEDLSGKTWELSVFDNSSPNDSVKGLYMYRNVFNLIPKSIGGFERLKTLKFFANEINLFPPETGNLIELEKLQIKISSPGISGLPLEKLKCLQELELFKVPPRPSAFSILSEIANLKCLRKLAVCHFSLRYLPPEIGCLSTLEDLDLSFNKLKSLPKEITTLGALRSLKIANNKLEELPIGLSLLLKLETLDLSNNRLTSLGSLELVSMRTLKKLELQYNKLLNCCQIPSWICCNLEGNGKDTSNDEFISSSVDVDIDEYEPSQNIDAIDSCKGSHCASTSLSPDTSSNRCSVTRRIGKGWKRRDYLQQKARQERLNSIRNRRIEDHQHMNVDECKDCKFPAVASDSLSKSSSDSQCALSSVKDLDGTDQHPLVCENNTQILLTNDENEKILFGSTCPDKGGEGECSSLPDTVPGSSFAESDEQGEDSSKNEKSTPKSKRQLDDDLENPKPRKSQKPFDSCSYLSNKYNIESFCSIYDHLPDGFYDAGRDRPFMPLETYEQSFCLDAREVILVDRKRDEELDVVASSAKMLLSRLKQQNTLVEQGEELSDDDDLQRASLLALFVSNWFGGCDRSNLTVSTRKAWSGSNYQKPFVCTCSTGNGNTEASSGHNFSAAENFNFNDLCEKSLRIIKQARNSNIVPIGTLRWGVCRHRALLMKYLCDRMIPPIPCELVRGYLDFLPHAWNIVPVRRNGSLVRMVVDACSPTELREENDAEYFCRYVPSSRIQVPITSEDIEKQSCSFPSYSQCEKVETTSSSLMRYNFGSVEAVAKVRTLNTNGISEEEVKKFEYNCLGEVRILGALMKHPCIVEIYGHQISSKWVSHVEGFKEHRILQSAIWMEFIEGGSLRKYIERVSKDGEKHVLVELMLFIARDIACALAELHSRHIIHRDIKSENILIDLDRKRPDGTPVVKLCDFDRAVPLRSSSHTCCIAHHGIPPPDMCVGTPRWMAPEVLRAAQHRKIYGVEVDIWSYGCLLLELLTLKVPYASLPESDIHNLLQSGQRPPLNDKLEALASMDESDLVDKSSAELVGVEAETENLRFLVYLFRQCTQRNPNDRPTAQHLYDLLSSRINSLASSTT